MTRVFSLSTSEQKFVNDTKRSVFYQGFWILLGVIFLSFGMYLMTFNRLVFFHADRVFTHGKISLVLKESYLSQPQTNMERLQQVLVSEAYERFIPTLFSFLGSCALVWGFALILFIRIQSQWVTIFNKLNSQLHFNRSE